MRVGEELLIPLNLMKSENGGISIQQYTDLTPTQNETITSDPVDLTATTINENPGINSDIDSPEGFPLEVATSYDPPTNKQTLGDNQVLPEIDAQILAQTTPITLPIEKPTPTEDFTPSMRESVQEINADSNATVVKPEVTINKPDSIKNQIAEFASIVTSKFSFPKHPTHNVSNTGIPADKSAVDSSETISPEEISSQIVPIKPLTLGQNVKVAQNTTIKAVEESEENTPIDDQWILIEGSFTPKAVYKGSAYGSGLLMRVSPGTSLRLTKSTDNWYEVETDKGSGYVLHRDAKIVE